MAASQQQQQQPQPQLQSPAQHGDVQTRGSGVAGPNLPLGSQAGLLVDALKKRAGHGLHSLMPNQDAASENGQKDPTHTTQATGQAHPAVSNSNMDATTADDQNAQTARRSNPPPSNPERLAHLTRVRALKDTDAEAYATEMAAFQAKYTKKTIQKKHNAVSSGNTNTQAPASKRKRKEAASDDADMPDRDAPPAKRRTKEERSKRSRGLHFPWCKNCQEFHLFGKHTKTKQEAQDLLHRQLYGLAPRPQLAAMQAAMDERREIMTANASRGQLSAQEAQASLDQRLEAHRNREMAFIGQHAPVMFSHLIQQQGPEAGYNFLARLHNGTVTQFPAQLQYPAPMYGYQAQPQAAEMQGTAPQLPMPYSGTAYGVPTGTQYDATPSRVPQQAAKGPARTPRDATER
ncbi:hypothetical protein MBLNU13_g08716t2 [Cladosporium sp. NU13]